MKRFVALAIMTVFTLQLPRWVVETKIAKFCSQSFWKKVGGTDTKRQALLSVSQCWQQAARENAPSAKPSKNVSKEVDQPLVSNRVHDT